jgi:hypothetical protein
MGDLRDWLRSRDEARSAFATARDIARRQGAVIFERRSQASLSEFAANAGGE